MDSNNRRRGRAVLAVRQRSDSHQLVMSSSRRESRSSSSRSGLSVPIVRGFNVVSRREGIVFFRLRSLSTLPESALYRPNIILAVITVSADSQRLADKVVIESAVYDVVTDSELC